MGEKGPSLILYWLAINSSRCWLLSLVSLDHSAPGCTHRVLSVVAPLAMGVDDGDDGVGVVLGGGQHVDDGLDT